MDQVSISTPAASKSGKLFSVKEAIKFGWNITCQKWAFFAGIILISGILSAISSGISSAIDEEKDPNRMVIWWVLYIIFAIIGMVVTLGFIKIALKVHDGVQATIKDLFSQYSLVFKYFLASLLYGLMVLGGLILLVVPGVIWAVKYQYFAYFIVEGSGPIAAIKKSGLITKGEKWHLFWVGILLGLINVAGVLALVIGLFWTMPTVALAMAFIYRKLQAQLPASTSTI